MPPAPELVGVIQRLQRGLWKGESAKNMLERQGNTPAVRSMLNELTGELQTVCDILASKQSGRS